ncbi:unnamed protein product [Periconia digitata]|uniref:Beta-lactamase-related domain-containing protein n=1 Tax=Periconia digitata TaxID=1303443 RepID=A0A9W4UQT3_9PLEO|nr:unnamed protein product [Periconia digitata]
MDTSLLPSSRDGLVISLLVVPIFSLALYLAPQDHNKTSTSKWKSKSKKNKMASSPKYCPPPGYSLPLPTVANVSPLPTFISDDLVKSFPWFNTTTFAVKASIGDTPVAEYSSRPPTNTSASLPSLFNTKFRIASVSKLFTVLAVLLSKDKIGWDDSITTYVPGLDATAYKDVTISGLAGQTSGLGRQGYVGDLSFIGVSPSLLGIPPTNASLPGCDPFPGGTVCNPSEVLDMFNNPLYQPQSPESIPSYSNIAYNLLGMALESVHPNQTFAQIMKKLVFDPADMPSAGYDTPTDPTQAILPGPGDRWDYQPFANHDPTGGIWTTPTELHRFAQTLRKHKFLSPAETKRWLQPRSFTSSMLQFVGAPWETIRPTDLGVTPCRPIEVYTKLGGVGGYTAYLVLIPEFDITITINVSGNDANRAITDLFPLLVKGLTKYADEVARKQALEKYAGTYKSSEGGNSSLTLSLDNGPGLKIGEFMMNGVPVVTALATLQKIPPQVANANARLYPTSKDDGDESTETWRMHVPRPLDAMDGFAELNCATWTTLDPARFVGTPLEMMKLKVGGEKGVEIELPAWRSTLVKSG